MDHYAHPERGQEWADEMQRRSVSTVAFRREFLRDWTSAGGEPFYPEFVRDPARFIRPCPGLIDAPVVRGWDFGSRHPACSWLQYSPGGRMWFLREVIGTFIDPHSFRDLVLYLSGELPLDRLQSRPRAMQHLLEIEENRALPRPPWFRLGVRFMDFAGHESVMRHGYDGKIDAAQDILAEAGISLRMHYTSPKAREEMFRRLMLPGPDGWPRCFVDPACPELAKGLGGGIAFKKPTKADPRPNEAARDGWFEHIHDGAGYGACGIAPIVEERGERGDEPQEYVYVGREPVPLARDSGFEVSDYDPTRW